jgi:hypothetical protein
MIIMEHKQDAPEKLGIKIGQLELVQKIGNEICEGCGPDVDCGIEPLDCERVLNAIGWLEDYNNF